MMCIYISYIDAYTYDVAGVHAAVETGHPSGSCLQSWIRVGCAGLCLRLRRDLSVAQVCAAVFALPSMYDYNFRLIYLIYSILHIYTD